MSMRLFFFIFFIFFIAFPSLLSAQPKPGGVSSNLVLWLKADEGVYSDRSGAQGGSTVATSGDAVQSWADLSAARTNDATGINEIDVPTFYDNATYNLNYNAVLRFDGLNDGLNFYDDYIFGTNAGMEFFAVVKPDNTSTGNGDFIFNFGGFGGPDGGYGMAYSYQGMCLYVQNDWDLWIPKNMADWSADPVLMRGQIVFSSSFGIYYAGASYATGTITQPDLSTTYVDESSTHTTDAGPFSIGRKSESNVLTGYLFQGNIAEIIGYDDNLSATEIQKIQSYLALKYGIALAAGAGNYIASDGTAIWDATANASFHHGVAGIGRDDNSGLSQKQSRSVEPGSVLSIGLGGLSATNSANGNAFTADGDFLVWGHDGDAATLTESFNGIANTRMDRVWTVQSTGAPGELVVGIPDTSITLAAGEQMWLVVSSDLTFDSNDAAVAMTNDGTWYTADYEFTGGEYFTFYKSIPCSDNLLSLTIQLDNNPGETTWEVLDASDVVVVSGGPYGTAGGLEEISLCLADGNYTLKFYDSGSDGMCCASGSGYYSLEDDAGPTIAWGRSFCDEETTAFTLPYVASGPAAGPGGVTDGLALWLKADNGAFTDRCGTQAGGTAATSGDAVMAWKDLSQARINDATAINYTLSSEHPVYYNNAEKNINGNPVLEFDGNDGLDLYDDYLFSDNDGVMLFAVVLPDDDATSTYHFLMDFGSYNSDGYGLSAGRTFSKLYAKGILNMSSPTAINSEVFFLRGGIHAGTEVFVGYNGFRHAWTNSVHATVDASTINEQATHAADAGPFTIGRQSKTDSEAGRAFKGRVSEIIAFDKILSTSQIAQVESYLSLKYGVPYYAANGTWWNNYYSSQGTLIWDTLANDGYNHNICAIGRDDGSTFYHKQSRINKTDATITVALGDIATTNDANPGVFTVDESYLLWGNNWAWPYVGTQSGSTITTRKEFRFRLIGTVGEVEIGIKQSDVTLTGCQKLYMMVSDDDNFTAADTMVLMQPDGDLYTCMYTFEDGDYMAMIASEDHCAVELPAGDIVVSDHCDRDGDTWSYYYDPNDEERLLFAIEHNPASGSGTNTFTCDISLSTTADPADVSGIYNNEDAANDSARYTLGRYWNVTYTGGSHLEPVNLRFYFDPDDTLALHQAAQDFSLANGGALQISNIQWFKTVGEEYDPVNLTVGGYDGSSTALTDYVVDEEDGLAYVEFRNITSFSGGSGSVEVTPGGVLPVDLLSFDARSAGKAVVLNWKTASEENTEKFVIQRSVDLLTWQEPGSVAAVGFSETRQEYTFTDKSPLFGASYYRLKIVDFDGYTEYSPIRNVHFEMESMQVHLYPNPAKDQFTVEIAEEDVWFEMFNATGRQETIEVELRDGKYRFSTHHLAKGLYFLKVHTPAQEETVKVVIE